MLDIRKCALLLINLYLTACKSPEVPPKQKQQPTGAWSEGILVLCEGTFGFGNASLSFISLNDSTVNTDVYSAANGRALGDQAQMMQVTENAIYICVQNSGVVEVLNVKDFKSKFRIGKIGNDRISPRYLTVTADKVYIADWKNDRVWFLGTQTMQPEGYIPTFEDPEYVLVHQNKLYIACAAYSKTIHSENKILVYDINKNQYTDTLVTGARPIYMTVDGNGKLWVLCRGFEGATTQSWLPPRLQAWDLTSNTLIQDLDLSLDPVIFYPATNAVYVTEQHTLYFVQRGAIHKLELNTLKRKSYMIGQIVYGLHVDAKLGHLWVCTTPDFTSRGQLQIFRLPNSDALSPIRSYSVGVLPNQAVRIRGDF